MPRVSSLTYGCPARTDCSYKVSWLRRVSAFLFFSPRLTTIRNRVSEQCRLALSHFWESLLPTSSYSDGFVQPYIKRKAARRRHDYESGSNEREYFVCKMLPFVLFRKPLWGSLWEMSAKFRQLNRVGLRMDLTKS